MHVKSATKNYQRYENMKLSCYRELHIGYHYVFAIASHMCKNSDECLLTNNVMCPSSYLTALPQIRHFPRKE